MDSQHESSSSHIISLQKNGGNQQPPQQQFPLWQQGRSALLDLQMQGVLLGNASLLTGWSNALAQSSRIDAEGQDRRVSVGDTYHVVPPRPENSSRQGSPPPSNLGDNLGGRLGKRTSSTQREGGSSRQAAAEQRRRQRINEKLEQLRAVVPDVDPRTNTADFLNEVLEYIESLKTRVSQLESEVVSSCTLPAAKPAAPSLALQAQQQEQQELLQREGQLQLQQQLQQLRQQHQQQQLQQQLQQQQNMLQVHATPQHQLFSLEAQQLALLQSLPSTSPAGPSERQELERLHQQQKETPSFDEEQLQHQVASAILSLRK